jgi:hypothetical protein
MAKVFAIHRPGNELIGEEHLSTGREADATDLGHATRAAGPGGALLESVVVGGMFHVKPRVAR